jgi:hypothetical protein
MGVKTVGGGGVEATLGMSSSAVAKPWPPPPFAKQDISSSTLQIKQHISFRIVRPENQARMYILEFLSWKEAFLQNCTDSTIQYMLSYVQINQ